MERIHNFFNRITKTVVLYCIPLIFSMVLVSSCGKNVLDQVPTGNFSDEAVWKDANLIDAFVNSTYRAIPTGVTFYSQHVGGAGDEIHDGSESTDFIVAGNMTPSELGVLDFWRFPYPGNYTVSGSFWDVIAKCNLFFSKIDAAPIDTTLKNRMIGEMQFFKAFAYFKLVGFYGGVPLITKPFALTDNFNLPRNTYDECMNFVISELDSAAALLPLTYPDAELGMITKGAALAAKSRALLYMASPLNNPSNSVVKWQAAADAAKAVIDLNLYALYPDYKSLFLRANSYNSEVIWSRPYNYSVSPEQTFLELDQMPNGYGGWGNDCSPYQNLVDEFEMVSGKLPKDDPSYDPQNPYVNRDPRFYAMILYDGAPFQGRPVETFHGGLDSREGPIGSWNGTKTGYYLRKFIDESIINPTAGLNQGNSPWIFFRYAELLLNYAEAEYNLGDEATCKQYINMVRSRPGVNMPLVTESGAALLTRLQHERQIELCFEEHRWFDVRRWKTAPVELNKLPLRMDIVKDPSGIKTYTVNPMGEFIFSFTNKDYLAPIPQSEIDKNPLLVQNPGY
jgi:hypothetical protein